MMCFCTAHIVVFSLTLLRQYLQHKPSAFRFVVLSETMLLVLSYTGTPENFVQSLVPAVNVNVSVTGYNGVRL